MQLRLVWVSVRVLCGDLLRYSWKGSRYDLGPRGLTGNLTLPGHALRASPRAQVSHFFLVSPSPPSDAAGANYVPALQVTNLKLYLSLGLKPGTNINYLDTGNKEAKEEMVSEKDSRECKVV